MKTAQRKGQTVTRRHYRHRDYGVLIKMCVGGMWSRLLSKKTRMVVWLNSQKRQN